MKEVVDEKENTHKNKASTSLVDIFYLSYCFVCLTPLNITYILTHSVFLLD